MSIADIGVGDIVRHFKGKYYRIIGFGEHTETGEEEVIYQALYPPYSTWVQPYDMFMSKVDNAKQEYRFEVMTISELLTLASEERLRAEGVISGQMSFNEVDKSACYNFDSISLKDIGESKSRELRSRPEALNDV